MLSCVDFSTCIEFSGWRQVQYFVGVVGLAFLSDCKVQVVSIHLDKLYYSCHTIGLLVMDFMILSRVNVP